MFRKNVKISVALIPLMIAVIFGVQLFSAPTVISAQNETMLSIPSINVHAPVVPLSLRVFPDNNVTWDTSEITSQVGYFQGTARLGQGGNTVLGGHSELDGRAPTVFYDLDKVAVGDEIIVTEGGRELRYMVTSLQSVAPDDLSAIQPTTSERLTIITCDTASFEGGDYNRRVVVVAERIN